MFSKVAKATSGIPQVACSTENRVRSYLYIEDASTKSSNYAILSSSETSRRQLASFILQISR